VAKGLDPALIGRSIAGKFTIESYIGAGAMGAVYKASQVALDKTVAVKVLHRELTTDDAFTSRFKREAKAASRLDHPNSVRVIDFGIEPDGLMYIAMELLDGRDLLRVLVDDWPLSGPRIASILMQALAALSVAHDLGVVHRDLKPENIMILAGVNDEGQATDLVKVCDFGIAKMSALRNEKVSQAGGPLTGQGLVVGTPEYMSPEQGRGDALDLRSDLYSMGVILYQLLTGRVPFDAESALGIVFKHVTEAPIRPSVLNPVVDLRLESICLRAMSKLREDRHQSAREMRNELRAVLGGSAAYILPPSSSSMAVEDTAPMPLMTRDRSSGALPDAGASDPALVSRSSGAPANSAPERPEPAPKTTSSTSAFLGSTRPARPPSPALLGFAVTALGAVLVTAFVVHRTSSGGQGSAPATPVPVPASASSGGSEAPPASRAGGGADPETVATEADPSSSSAPPGTAATAAGAPRAPRSQAHPASASVAASPPSPAAAPSPAAGLSPATPRAASSFSLATASANPSVVRADGASPQNVRVALPGAIFTQCYRDALKRGDRRLEGKMSVHVQISGEGHVTTALVSAPESLAQGVGQCITQAFDRLPIAGVAAAGGAADIQIVFLPE
jgi:serine/threonine protein kinase